MFTSPLSLEMQELLGPVKYVDSPNTLTCSCGGPCILLRGVEEISADAWHTDMSGQGILHMGCSHSIQPNTDTIWMEREQTTAASGLNSAVWLVIAHEPWPLTMTDSWADLKGLNQFLG